jgi:hypothetical protein
LTEDVEHTENFDMNVDISISVLTDDDASQVEGGDVVSVPSNPSKATRGRKGKRAGISLSPTKTKVKRGKRAGCWKYFKEIHVQSEEFGVMASKAKCRFYLKSYAYQQGGATSQLNCHLAKCTQFQNKLTQAKRQLAQGTLNYVADDGCLVVNPTEYDHEHTRKLIAKMIIVGYHKKRYPNQRNRSRKKGDKAEHPRSPGLGREFRLARPLWPQEQVPPRPTPLGHGRQRRLARAPISEPGFQHTVAVPST